VVFDERMPGLSPAAMDDVQRKAAEELTAGPRGGVKGPFVALLRSPELMDRLQRVGEYLRFNSALDARIGELAMLIVSREWTQQFEWCTHVPLSRKAGLSQSVIDALAEGRRPSAMAKDEEAVYDLLDELSRTRGVSAPTYQRVVELFGERGVVDLLGVAGYFTALSMLMNAVHTPPPPGTQVRLLTPFPL
jgi:4-carboxymuconolactone decarboxylase